MTEAIKDSNKGHWVNRSPVNVRPYLQLSRLDRPIGYWLLALPGWIGLAFATLSHGFAQTDLKWAAFLLIGAIAMRGAACTYNDIVDQDLDAKVERTALRPLPAGTVTTKQAWIWTFAQCGIGLIVLLCLPRLAQLISLGSIPLVAAYPFMKRITWWPQAWLGFTFNWAVLVAYAAKTGTVTPTLFILYLGLVFWTIGYDTIYACQDVEDDMKVGVKSTARRFGKKVKWGVGLAYLTCCLLLAWAIIASFLEIAGRHLASVGMDDTNYAVSTDDFWFFGGSSTWIIVAVLLAAFPLHLTWQVWRLHPEDGGRALHLFKSNRIAAFLLIFTLILLSIGFAHVGLTAS